MAKTWNNVGEEWSTTTEREVNRPVPDDDTVGLTSDIVISENRSVEFVDVTLDIPDHPKIGDLEVILISPQGTESLLAERHRELFDIFRYTNWRFGTTRHLGESSAGTWRLTVKDRGSGETGEWKSWGLTLYGAARSIA